MLQIDSEGLIFFGNQRSNTEYIKLSNSSHPAVFFIPFLRRLINGTLDSILYHRIVTSEKFSILREIDSIITEFNRDLDGFNSTMALIATWQVCSKYTCGVTPRFDIKGTAQTLKFGNALTHPLRCFNHQEWAD